MYLKMVNAMSAYADVNSYVKDGLIFHLDGIITGTNNGYWTDLVGGLKFDISTLERITNGYHFYNTPINADKKINYIVNNSLLTAEFVIRMDQTSGNIYLLNGGNGTNISVTSYNNGLLTLFRGTFSPQYNMGFPTSTATISASVLRCYKNKQPVSASGINWWGETPDVARIGGGATSTMLQGDLFAFRLYNRILTEEEVLKNQNVDIRRFGLQI